MGATSRERFFQVSKLYIDFVGRLMITAAAPGYCFCDIGLVRGEAIYICRACITTPPCGYCAERYTQRGLHLHRIWRSRDINVLILLIRWISFGVTVRA